MIKYLTLRSYVLIKLYYIGEKTYVINFDVYKNKTMKEKHTLILIFISVISYTKHSILFGVKLFFFIYCSYRCLIVADFDLQQGKCRGKCINI